MKNIIQSIRILIVFTLLLGGVYPLAVTLIGNAFFPGKAGGSLIRANDKVLGSELLAQKCEDTRYFWPRPSGGDYATIASGASNKGPTSIDLAKAIDDRRKAFGDAAPGDMLTASGSGLDPHISPGAALYQAARVADARKLQVADVTALVEKFVEPPQFGILGEARVNVLALNLALDKLH